MNQTAKPAPPAPQGNRSEGLLPADENDPQLDIAEEVAFDLQSDPARKVGALPDKSAATEAVADSLRPDQPGRDDSARPG